MIRLWETSASAGKTFMNRLATIDIAAPSTLLYVFIFFAQFLTGIYSVFALELPSLFVILYPVVTTWLVWWWLKEDSLRTGQAWPIDLGLFLFVAWPVIVPYYLISTRGLKGLVGVGIFVAVLAAGWIGALLTAIVFSH